MANIPWNVIATPGTTPEEEEEQPIVEPTPPPVAKGPTDYVPEVETLFTTQSELKGFAFKDVAPLANLLAEEALGSGKLKTGVFQTGLSFGTGALSALAGGATAMVDTLLSWSSTDPQDKAVRAGLALANEDLMDVPEAVGQKTRPDEFVSVFNQIAGLHYTPPEDSVGYDMTEMVGNVFTAAREFTGDSVYNATGSPAAGATAYVIPDAALMLLGGLWARGKVRDKPTSPLSDQVASVEVANALAAQEGSPLATARGHMKWSALSDLKGSKPHIKDKAAFDQLIKDIENGKNFGDIIVETEGGRPIQVLSGAENIFIGRQMQARGGVKFKEIEVTFQERASIPSNEAAAAAQRIKAADSKVGAMLKETELLSRQAQKGLKEGLVSYLVDASGNVKQALINNFGEAGREAVMRLELSAGATPHAHLTFQNARQEIYGKRGTGDPALSDKPTYQMPDYKRDGKTVQGPKLSERQLFDIYLRMHRIVEIAKSKTRKNMPKFEVTPEQAGAWLADFPNKVGKTRAAQLRNRADVYFRAHKDVLKKLYDNGLISKSDYRNMKNIDYQKTEKLRFFDRIDPKLDVKNKQGQPMSVGESGVYYFGKGTSTLVNYNSEMLLAETIGRSYNRIAKNTANQVLYKIAQENPKNGIVRVLKSRKDEEGKYVKNKPDFGFVEFNARVNGKKVTLQMRQDLASEWILGDPNASSGMISIARVISGSSLVRPLATGYNPGFAVTNLARDIQHIYRASDAGYSSVLPVYLGQMARDLLTVSKDAWTKKGRYEKFIEEGGGMNFLTHQGQNKVIKSGGAEILMDQLGANRGKYKQRLEKITSAMAKLNEFSELWTRLAIRERGIRSGLDNVTSTWQARRYLDFSQGGLATKHADNYIPYLNASAQALRGVARQYKEKPITAAARDLQLAGVFLSSSIYNWLHNRELMEDLSPEQRFNNVVIPTDHYFDDARGNRRRVFFGIKKDSTINMYLTPMEMVAERLIGGRVPHQSFFDALDGLVPITSMPPTYSAAIALFMNRNTYTNDEIWRGPEYARPGDRFTDNTSPIFKQLGEVAPETISPDQLEVAFKSFVPNNTYTNLGYSMFNYIQNEKAREEDPNFISEFDRAYSQSILAALNEAPILGRMIYLTHPAANQSVLDDELQGLQFHDTKTYQDALNRELQNQRDQGVTDMEALVDLATAAAGENPFRLQRYVLGSVTAKLADDFYRKAAKSNPEIMNHVPPSWWGRLGAIGDATDRAEVFYETWRSGMPEERKAMESVMLIVSNSPRAKSLASKEFWWAFENLKKERGTEPPATFGLD